MTPIIVYIALLVAAGIIFFNLYAQNLSLKRKLDSNKNAVVQLFTFCSDGIIVLDQEYRVVSLNPSAERITGWKQREIPRDISCNQLFQCCHEDGSSLTEEVCPLKSGLQTLHNSEGSYGEFMIRTRDGSRRLVSASYFQIGGQDSDSPQFIMQLRDITQRAKENAQIDIIQEFVSSPYQVWDLQKIYETVEAKCRKVFSATHVALYLGKRLHPRNLAEETLAQLQPWVEEVCSKKELLEKNLENRNKCILVPLLIERDELGVLVLYFDTDIPFSLAHRKKLTLLAAQTAVVCKLHTLLEYSNERRKEMEELYKLSILIRSSEMEKGLDYHVMEDIRRMVRADVAAVLLYDKHHRLQWNSYSGPPQLLHNEVFGDSTLDMMRFGNFSVLHRTDHAEHALFYGNSISSFAVSPIVYRDSVYGILLVGMKEKKEWNEHETYLIQNISSSIAVQIRNRHLHRKVENEAILIERGRISREIHDGLAQAIGYVNIQMHRITAMLEQGRLEQALTEIGAVREVIAQSYGDIRETITNLRLDQPNMDFVVWIKNHIHEFQRITGLRVNLEMDEKLPEISEEIRVQVTRVIQEALTNIKKHAKASLVKLEVRNNAGNLFVRISDNGQGISNIPRDLSYMGGHGLTIMRERIQSINGTLTIDSKPNAGTTITIDLGERRLENVW